MPRLIKRRSKKVGLPPGTFVHIGEQKAEEVRITVIDYDEAHFQEQEIEAVEDWCPPTCRFRVVYLVAKE